MAKLILHPTLIYRVPRFSYIEKIDNNLEELKSMIKDSSPDLYTMIENLTLEDFQDADRKIQLSLRKYFNRAIFRSTPFGSFASVGTARMENDPVGRIKITKQQKVHSFTDWAVKSAIEYDPAKLLNANVKLFANTSYYVVQNEIRYLQMGEDNFEMTAIDFDPIIIDILKCLIEPKPYDILVKEMDSILQQDELNDYLYDLISIQLIITSQQPNIIGLDFFNRIGRQFIKEEKAYLIAERTTLTGCFNKEHFKQLPALADILSCLVHQDTEIELEQFKQKFFQRFEQAEVPIMMALDPEIGIGYGEMNSDVHSSPLIHKLATQVGTSSRSKSDNGFKDIIGNTLLEKGLDGIIQLEELMGDIKETKLLPNTLNAVCSLKGNQVYLDYLGGVTATSLFGRFAFAIPTIKKFCNEIVSIETNANPDVIFFDIGYTKEDDVDNINRRPSIYNFQLNLLNYDTSEMPLSLTDIYISIQRNEVILRSATYNKRLVPRVASAYNYQRSDLPLFRFLMAIESQSLQSNLLFRPSTLMPGLPRYPRIQFRNIIVSPASFRISAELLKGPNGLLNKVTHLQKHLIDHLPFDFYKVGKGDQKLCLHTKSKTDTEILLSLLEKSGILYLEETTMDADSCIRDENGAPYECQLILTLYHQEKVVLPVISNNSHGKEIRNWIPPGQNWLYFELYCSPIRSDIILTEKIGKYLSVYNSRIKKWFFIRYLEGGDHIRLRIELYDANDAREMTGMLSGLLQEELSCGTISDIKLCTYKKEVHRYSSALITEVENHFQQDSIYILHMLQFMLPDLAKYKLCMDIFDTIQSSQVFKDESFKNTLAKVSQSLNIEHKIQPDGFKEINKQYKGLLMQTFPSLSEGANTLHAVLKDSFISTLEKCPVFRRPEMFANLFHMHINRLFRQHQRTHELLIYNFGLMDFNRKFHQGKAKAN
ncbi:MAG: thiopeptide-type bacteriocin biosynthesis protein [Candidatus Pedobacter colombiensis]|uniref:Thiopeptide-type bacteriocin biosynthesis protein n=1 Tax=Candidatus Pedobacter colombiensis TaxID=3121371 RepID=A0AAJ5W6A9_9SPHI|nr:lantibiotic dehydratase [Pedobacter sp.]WEK17923.1 MAG: thiopeptide-type bacteriocin biosynthesis protein [Pedobacter sp.]